jgi:hypothetical protein
MIEKYGHCIIPKNTCLFHKGYIHKNADSVFFGLNPITAKANPGPEKDIQIWKVKKDIQLLFMVTYVAHFSWTKSAIVEIYQSFFPKEKFCDDIEIKYKDRSKRKKLIDKLKEQGIIGWFSSYDDRQELEICIFNCENFYQFIEISEEIEMDTLYAKGFINPLKKMLLYPNENFFKLSRDKLFHFPFIKYKKHVSDCIEEELKLASKKYCQNSNFDLRMKFKI